VTDFDNHEDEDAYDAGWQSIRDHDDFVDWLLDDDAPDPELNGTDLYDELLDDYDDEPDADWEQTESWEDAEPVPTVLAVAAHATPSTALPPGALRFGPPPALRPDTPEDPEVWHLTHVYNFQLMCATGALAPTPACPWGVRPGLRDLVGKRARRPTELGPMVGDCVPFYFTVATPFSYRVLAPGWSAELVEPAGTSTIQTHSSHYVFLRSTVRRIVADGSGDWMVTNGNAGAHATQAWRSLSHLHCVDWSAVTSRWSSTNQVHRQAELLVSRDVQLSALTSIHVPTDEVAARVRSVAGEWSDRVVADSLIFAKARGQ
jgi:hypothetical protein